MKLGDVALPGKPVASNRAVRSLTRPLVATMPPPVSVAVPPTTTVAPFFDWNVPSVLVQLEGLFEPPELMLMPVILAGTPNDDDAADFWSYTPAMVRSRPVVDRRHDVRRHRAAAHRTIALRVDRQFTANTNVDRRRIRLQKGVKFK